MWQKASRVRMLLGQGALAIGALLAWNVVDVLAHEPGALGPRQLVLSGPARELSGTFHVIYGDAPPGASAEAVAAAMLHDDAGQSTELVVDAAEVRALGGFRALNGRRVTVHGVLAAPDTSDSLPLLSVSAMGMEPGTASSEVSPMAVSGSKPWVTILCKFADYSTTSHVPSWFTTLMTGGTAPSLDHYWRQVSYNTVNLTGSTVAGWFTLPSPRAAYLPGGSLNFGKALQDCTAAADASVNFPSFVGINLMFNADLDGYAWGGSSTLTRDGVTRSYSVTWLPPWGYENQGVIAHEMGHGFGLPHSSGPYSATYDSRWDVMSGLWGNCPPYDSVYGCTGVHTIAYHKDLLGWVPGAQKYVAGPGSDRTITIEQLGQLAASGNYVMAQIPMGSSATRFYTVEVRRFLGYDTKLPGQAAVIHKVDTTLFDRDAQVVDTDGNGNPNDAGAMWQAGESFTDGSNGIAVTLTAATPGGFQVRIVNGAPTPPTVTSLAASTTFPASVGVPMTWTATATGGTAPLQYQFWRYDFTTGLWTIVQPYGTSNKYTWLPSPPDAGDHVVAVWVRGASSTAAYDATMASSAFAVQGTATPISVTITSDHAPTVPAGTRVTWTALASGGPAPLRYEFWRLDKLTQTWALVQSSSTRKTYSWMPKASEAGQYKIRVWVRGDGSTADYDAKDKTVVTVLP